jgi:DNA modification methylase
MIRGCTSDLVILDDADFMQPQWTLHQGDCLEVLPTLEESLIDTCICDPPYGLRFMQASWDHGVPGVPYWLEVLRVLKPGGVLLAFGGTRTHHRLMCAIEDAGFELKDCLMWLYGTGVPKVRSMSREVDRTLGAEPTVIAPYSTPAEGYHLTTMNNLQASSMEEETQGRRQAVVTEATTPEAALWEGWHSGLKPAWEPIVVAMKPLNGTFAQNALTHGVAGFHVDACRIPVEGSSRGRWPANVVLEEDVARELDEQVGMRKSGKVSAHHKRNVPRFGHGGVYGDDAGDATLAAAVDCTYGDEGGVSRYFYCPKASTQERTCGGLLKNNHPTLKPLALMRWLVRLTETPTGGVVLDPFAGSGSTGVACLQEGRSFVGIELEEEHAAVARERLRIAVEGPTGDVAPAVRVQEEPQKGGLFNQWSVARLQELSEEDET